MPIGKLSKLNSPFAFVLFEMVAFPNFIEIPEIGNPSDERIFPLTIPVSWAMLKWAKNKMKKMW
jgi:hypothetical protein